MVILTKAIILALLSVPTILANLSMLDYPSHSIYA